MRSALWPLIFSLLLQLVAGGVWARGHGQDLAGHCHDSGAAFVASAAQVGPGDAADASSLDRQTQDHHCCSVGLGEYEAPLPFPPAQVAPAQRIDSWVSLTLRPDLRPPI